VAMIGLDSPDAALKLLVRAKDETGGAVEAFELMGRRGIEFVLKNIANQRDPLAEVHPWYVLIEIASGEPGTAEAAMERLLAQGLEDGLVRDAAVAQTEAQAKAFWSVRENQSPGQKPEGATWKHDVAVPVSKVPVFLAQATAAMAAFAPGARIAAFGHVGDGNIHYNCSKSERQEATAFFAASPEVNRVVYDVVNGLGGSISAEHGLGVLKRDEIRLYKSVLELDLMRSIKRTLDPHGLMNPGKVL